MNKNYTFTIMVGCASGNIKHLKTVATTLTFLKE